MVDEVVGAGVVVVNDVVVVVGVAVKDNNKIQLYTVSYTTST